MGKRKRTELESLLEGSSAVETNSQDEWTPRENYELMLLYQDQPGATAKQKSDRLHRKMSGLCETNLWSPKPQRSELEIRTQRRDLMNSGVTIEDLEEEIWPDEKKNKKQKKAKKDAD